MDLRSRGQRGVFPAGSGRRERSGQGNAHVSAMARILPGFVVSKSFLGRPDCERRRNQCDFRKRKGGPGRQPENPDGRGHAASVEFVSVRIPAERDLHGTDGQSPVDGRPLHAFGRKAIGQGRVFVFGL